MSVDASPARGGRQGHAQQRAAQARAGGGDVSVTQAAVKASELTFQCAHKALYNSTVGTVKDAWSMAKTAGAAWWSHKKLEVICVTQPWRCASEFQKRAHGAAVLAQEFQKGLDAIPGLWDSVMGMSPLAKAELICPILYQAVLETGVGVAVTVASGGAGAGLIAAKIALHGKKVLKLAGLAKKLQRLPNSKHLLESFARLKPGAADKFSRMPADDASRLSREALSACGF